MGAEGEFFDPEYYQDIKYPTGRQITPEEYRRLELIDEPKARRLLPGWLTKILGVSIEPQTEPMPKQTAHDREAVFQDPPEMS